MFLFSVSGKCHKLLLILWKISVGVIIRPIQVCDFFLDNLIFEKILLSILFWGIIRHFHENDVQDQKMNKTEKKYIDFGHRLGKLVSNLKINIMEMEKILKSENFMIISAFQSRF